MNAQRRLPRKQQVWRVGRLSLVISPRLVTVTVVLLAATVALGIVAMTVGTLRLSFSEVAAALFGTSGNPQYDRIVQNLRLPRVVTAIFAGAALGVSGAIFQSVSRNALGSPDVIGFTTGAATGAIMQIVVFDADAVQVALGAVSGGLLTAAVVYLLSRKGGTSGGYRLILVGIGVGAVLAAVNDLLLVVGDLDQAISANLWRSGSLDARTWTHALPVAVGTLVLVPLVLPLARQASLMEMGDDVAQQLGVRVERTRVLLMLAAVALAGLATAAAGPIAFIALAAPQLVARLTRWRTMPVLSAAAMGACLLVLADVVTRLLPITAAVPIGRMTGIIGGLYLIWMLTRSKQV
ncbi:Fe(3+)-siderophore ABC transporter permease [Micromonospora polyrhachis]|uniref:Iron complex transport system permease protein n=1 Tax=Micromonospora polyrhachis TaxID=1282883 RepID=A0A7W7SK88_9ACTN|nr:iron chelate uptake ABC transporter family permease subunit [Micromonospora polyrhachis]MBB4956318.1 iron complex transport system permease protein [Micromonospora polyrhachis]